jgi:hypothetical protein
MFPVSQIHDLSSDFNRAQWFTPVIPALRRLTQDVGLGYVKRLCLKTTTKRFLK